MCHSLLFLLIYVGGVLVTRLELILASMRDGRQGELELMDIISMWLWFVFWPMALGFHVYWRWLDRGEPK